MADSPKWPLDIMLSAMREKWENDQKDEAVEVARLAAPYLHARMIRRKDGKGLAQLTDQEIDELCAAAFDEESKGGAAS